MSAPVLRREAITWRGIVFEHSHDLAFSHAFYPRGDMSKILYLAKSDKAAVCECGAVAELYGFRGEGSSAAEALEAARSQIALVARAVSLEISG